jgi:hypothetical protein
MANLPQCWGTLQQLKSKTTEYDQIEPMLVGVYRCRASKTLFTIVASLKFHLAFLYLELGIYLEA